MQDLAQDYRRKMADAVTTAITTIKDAITAFDGTLVEIEAEFAAAANVRLRQFTGESTGPTSTETVQ